MVGFFSKQSLLLESSLLSLDHFSGSIVMVICVCGWKGRDHLFGFGWIPCKCVLTDLSVRSTTPDRGLEEVPSDVFRLWKTGCRRNRSGCRTPLAVSFTKCLGFVSKRTGADKRRCTDDPTKELRPR